MTASTRTLVDIAVPEAMWLPEELWIAIADIDDINVYRVLFCLSKWHHDVINREWMARIKRQLTESPQLEPHESARSYYHRMMSRYQSPLSPDRNNIDRAAELGLEKIVNSLMTPQYITKNNLFNLSRFLNYANPTLTLLLLSYIEKLPVTDQQPIILAACNTIVDNIDVHGDVSVSLELLWKKLSPDLRDKFFSCEKLDKESLHSEMQHVSYELYHLEGSGSRGSFDIEWKITRLCLTAANLRVVLHHFPEEQRDDLLESAIYLNLIFSSKLQVNRWSESDNRYARPLSALITYLSLPRKTKLLTNLQVMLNTLYAADLECVFEMDLVPDFFKVKAYHFSDHIKYRYSPKVQAVILAGGLYINFLIDPVDAMTNGESLFVTLNEKSHTDHNILGKTLKMYVGESADFALLQAFIDKLSQEYVVGVIVKLLLTSSLTYSQLEALFEHCNALSILDHVLAACVSSYYLNQILISNVSVYCKGEFGEEVGAEKKYLRIQRYFPNINWQKLTSDYFSNKIQNLEKLEFRRLVVVAKDFHLCFLDKSYTPSLEKHVMQSLLSDKTEQFSWLSPRHAADLLVKLLSYDEANNTALVAKFLHYSQPMSNKVAVLLMNRERNPYLMQSLPSLTVKILLRNFLEKVFCLENAEQMLLKIEKMIDLIIELSRYAPQEEASFMLFSVLNQKASGFLLINDFLSDSRRLDNKAFLTIFFAAVFYDLADRKKDDLDLLLKKINKADVDLSAVIIQAFKFAIRLSDDHMFNALKRKFIELKLMKPTDLREYVNGLMSELSGGERAFLRRMISDHFLVAPPSNLQLIVHPSSSRAQPIAVRFNPRKMGH